MKKFVLEKDYLEIFPDSKIGVLVCCGIDNHVKEEEKYAPYLREAEKQAAVHFTNPEVVIWEE